MSSRPRESSRTSASRSLEQRLVRRLRELIAIPSPSHQERQLADHLERQLRACPRFALQRIGDNLVVHAGDRGRRPCVLFCGHLDTVPAQDNLEPREEGDRIYGLGASDLKAGIAVLLELLADLDPAQLLLDPVFVFYTCEEVGYQESGLIEVERALPWIREADLAICVEPTHNAVELGCMGTLHAEVASRGVAAHSARPWLGQNALYPLLPLLQRVAALPVREVRIGDLLFRESLSPTWIHGGLARNVIPDRVTVNLNFRFAPDRSSEAAVAHVESLVGDAGAVAIVDLAPSGAVPRDNAWCDRLAKLAGTTRAKQAWTDVGRFTEWGVDAISFGPGLPEKAHQRDEYASLSAMCKNLELLEQFLAPREPVS